MRKQCVNKLFEFWGCLCCDNLWNSPSFHKMLYYVLFKYAIEEICSIPINFSLKHDTLSCKSLTFAMSILIPKAPMGRGWVDIYIIRRNCTLWFWQCKNFANSQLLVKNKATGTPHGVYCIQPLLVSDGCTVRCHWGNYILTSTWGFRRCSFRLAGQCEGLYTVGRVTGLAPRFLFLYMENLIK